MFAILCPLLIFLTVAPTRVHAAPSADEIAAYLQIQRNELVPLMIGSVFVLLLIVMVFGVMSKYLLSSLIFAMSPSPADMERGP